MRRLTIFLTLSLTGLVLWCAPALAHADLLKAEPASGVSVSDSPDQVRLRFNEPIGAEFSPIEVYDSSGKRVDKDDARISPDDSRVVEIGVGDLSKGAYRVEWRVTSVDGHVVDGKYNFEVKSASAASASGKNNSQANAGDNQKQNAKAASSGSSGESGSGGQDDTGGSGQTTLYIAVGVGVLVLIVLALFGATRLRRGKS